MAKKFINLYVLSLMAHAGQKAAAEGAAGASGGARQQKPPARKIKEWYTVVVYEKPRVKTVVLYVGKQTFTFKVPADREIRGEVKRQWSIGRTRAYSMRVHARDIAELLDAYVPEEAKRRKISTLDRVYRAAALQGYKVHPNELYVKLWLEHELGEPLFHVGDPLERKLGRALKHFTHSYRVWRMVTPPWAASPDTYEEVRLEEQQHKRRRKRRMLG